MAYSQLKKKDRFVLMILLLVLGAVVAMQTRSVLDSRLQEERKMAESLRSLEAQIAMLEEEVVERQQEADKLRSVYSGHLARLEEQDADFFRFLNQYNQSIDDYKLVAGLRTVSGAGIVLKIDDANPLSGGMTSLLMVHDSILSDLVNVLRAAGAQAISINGERVVPMTELLCVGPSIRINDTKVFPPYTIKAIGDPEQLELQMRDSMIYRTIVARNLIFDMQQESRIVINKYSGKYERSIQNLLVNYYG